MSHPLPATPRMIAQYLADRLDTLKSNTLEQRINAISFAHRTLRMPDPTLDPYVRDVLP